MPEKTTQPDLSKESAAKRPYATPRVRVYGDIRQVTQGLGMVNTYDGIGGMGTGHKSLP